MAGEIPTLNTREVNEAHGGTVPRITGALRFLLSAADGSRAQWVLPEDLPILVGSQGPQGAAGADGDDGAQGPQGATGAAGPQGDDGAQGPQGNAGAQGNQGAPGAQGDDGAQGPQGAAGSLPDQAESTLTGRAAGVGTGAPGELSATQGQTILRDGWAYISFGSSPAATGLIRTEHGVTLWAGKENGGTDRALATWGVVGTNELRIGNDGGNMANVVFSSTTTAFYDGSSARFSITGSDIRAFLPYTFDSGTSSPGLSQINAASGGSNPLTVRARGSTGASNAGSDLRLEGGRAGSGGAPGAVRIRGNRDDSTFDEGFAVDSSGSAARLGFYGATPAVKPAVAGTSGAQASASLRAELATLGLITNSNAGYLPYSSMCVAAVTGVSGSTSEFSVAFDQTDTIDTDAYHNPASQNTRFVAPATGVYEVSCAMYDGATGRTFNLRLRVDGSTYIAGAGSVDDLNAGGCVVFHPGIALTAGQYVEARLDAGGAYGSCDITFRIVRLS